MKNLEQIRAKNALEFSAYIGTGDGGSTAVAKKVPALIIQDGFIATLAFAIEKCGDGVTVKDIKSDKWYGDKAYANTFLAIMRHLTSDGIKKDYDTCANCGNDCLKGFLARVCECDSDKLRAITDEALAFLAYLRRFAKPEEKNKKE